MVSDDFAGIFFTCVMILAVLVYLGYRLLFHMQIHTLELWVTLLVSSLPLAIVLSLSAARGEIRTDRETAKIIAFCLFPAVLIFAGSVWGMSAIKRLDEKRNWPRLGLLAAGWGLVVGGLMVIPACVVVLKFSWFFLTSPAYLWSTQNVLDQKEFVTGLVAVPVSFFVLPGLWIERRCQGKGVAAKR